MVHVLKGMLDVYKGKATHLLLQSRIRNLIRSKDESPQSMKPFLPVKLRIH